MLGAWRVLRMCRRVASCPAPLSPWLVYPASGVPSLFTHTASLSSQAAGGTEEGSAAAAAAAAGASGPQMRRSKVSGSSSMGQPASKAGTQQALAASQPPQPGSPAQQRQRQQGEGSAASEGAPVRAAAQASSVRKWWLESPVWMPWEEWLKELQGFVAEHKRLPRRTGSQSTPLLPEEKQLGQWCASQRQRCKGNKLTAAEAAALEAIPDWFWEQRQPRRTWAEQRHRLEGFVQEHGRLPRATSSPSAPFLPDEKGLDMWSKWQRKRRKVTELPPLRPEQEASLEAVPGWFWEEFKKQPWERQCRAVAKFQRDNNRLPRNKGSRAKPLLPGERTLGDWCMRQRKRRKGKEHSQLSAEQQAALEAVPGWFWEQQMPWEQQCQAVAEFQQDNSRLPRGQGSKLSPLLPGEQALGKWCETQRQRWKGNMPSPLSAEQAAALEAIPGWFWCRAGRQK